MTIINSQVHAYEANTPKRPWHSVPNWPESRDRRRDGGGDGQGRRRRRDLHLRRFPCTATTPTTQWTCNARIPASFGIVKPVDPDDPAVDDVVADWKRTPGAVGIRIMLTPEAREKRAPTDPGLDRIARAAVKHDLPVNILFWGNVDAGTTLIDRHPDTRFIIDHLAILQPRTPPAPPQPWADLPKVLDLAKRNNAVIKVSGACTLSKEPYPFADIWEPLARVFDASVSSAACGAPTGRAPMPWSIPRGPPSPSSRPTA